MNKVNKTPRDLGVLGIEVTKQALNSTLGQALDCKPQLEFKLDKDYDTSTWGKESKEEMESKALASQTNRAKAMDKYSMFNYALVHLAKMVLLHRLISSALAYWKPRFASRLASIAVLVLEWYKFGARNQPDPFAGRVNAWTLPFFGHLHQTVKNKSRHHAMLAEYTEQAGFKSLITHIPSISLCTVMDARDREYVLKTNFRNYLKNRENDAASFEYIFAEIMGRGIFAADKREWQDARKVASHMFSGTSLKLKMEQVFNTHADHFVEYLQDVEEKRLVVDIQEAFQSCVFDGFCEIAFGVSSGALAMQKSEGKKPAFLTAFDACQAHCSERFLLPPLVWHLQRLAAHVFGVGEAAEFAKQLLVLTEYVDTIVTERMRDETVHEKQDLLSLYIMHAKTTGQTHMLEREFLRDTVINFMIAGRDTTSCTLSYMIKFLSENREVEQRILNEALVENQTMITLDDTKTKPFAEAVFNETIRMAPPVATDVRICVGDDVLPSGITLKDGYRVVISNLAIGRDPFLWDQPKDFNPERWMTYDGLGVAKTVKRPDEYVLPVFWAGKRLCLGKDMARFEAIVFMNKILSKFKINILPNQSEELASGPVMFRRDGILCTVEKRVV